MQFEKFVANDMRAALRKVRQALGEDAVVVATRTIQRPGLFRRGMVEIVASPADNGSAHEALAPAPSAAAHQSAERGYQAGARMSFTPPDAAGPPPAAPSGGHEREPLHELLRPLREELREMRAALRAQHEEQALPVAAHHDDTQAALRDQIADLKQMMASVQLGGVSLAKAAQSADRAILEAADVDPDVADALLADLHIGARADEPIGETAKRLERGIAFALPTVGDFFARGAARRIALLGPTGVGKTTTVAKIAAHAALKHDMKVALVSLDTYRIGAQEQLGQYAKLIGVPMAVAHDRRSLAEAMATYEDVDLLLIDTAGRGPDQAEAHCVQLRQMFARHGVEVFITLAAATRRFEREQMLEAMGELSQLGARALILTKLDEAVALGSCLSLTHQTGLPLAFVTAGQRVPEDLSPADGQALAKRLVGGVLQSSRFRPKEPLLAPLPSRQQGAF